MKYRQKKRKNRRKKNKSCLTAAFKIIRILFLEAVAAIYGTVSMRLKGNLAFFTAFCTYGVIHLTGCGAVASILACVTACFAALGLICETFFCVKFLFTGCEGEFLSAFFADEGLVFVHDIPLLKK